uniref:Uncharacterized protein LOC104243292 n=1 Tax=Nicotiana sylvestris TaxID=4096 RepID=A0A1U7YBZ7_NICSY|nr:PREDICTED: uncharacterized protein LOC104243292 [Nicotiana sylvestris]
MDLIFRQKRWLELLKDYDITILYHLGKNNMLANVIRLDILEPSRVLACMVSRSFLYELIRKRQYDNPYLLVLKDTIQHSDAKQFTIGDDGVLRMQGRIYVSIMDRVCELILEEARNSWLTKSVNFIPMSATYSSEWLGEINIPKIVRLHSLPVSIISDRDFGGSWDQFLLLAEFPYNNNCLSSI